MTAPAIILGILILLALLRFGVNVEYSSDGLVVKAKAGPFLITVLPAKKKAPWRLRKAYKKRKRRRKRTKEKKPGGFAEFNILLPAVKETLNRFRKRFLIKRLTIIFTAAGTDAAKTALLYGNANVAIGIVDTTLSNYFRIRRRDFRAHADFNIQKPVVYIKAVVSLSVWEAVYIVFALLPVILSRAKRTQTKNDNTDTKRSNNADVKQK